MKNNEKIDIVLPWVDGNDPHWKKQKSEWECKIKNVDSSSINDARYRDWDNLKYVFRGIDKNMPWINKVHFVTWGHLPKWLNTQCPKLQIVNHQDFLPKDYLPTFNSNTIVLNIHRIPGIADEFILFNDDMFVIKETKPEHFFENGLPKDMAVISPPPCFRDVMCGIESNNIGIINDYFKISDIYKYRKKWFTIKNGNLLLRTILFSRFKTILGIYEPHIANSYLKSSFIEVWDKEYDVLDNSSRSKFRSREDVNDWLVRQWQIMSGDFYPRSRDYGLMMNAANVDEVIKKLKKPKKCHMICINDTIEVKDFDLCRDSINKALNDLLPEKSIFEI